MPVARAIHTRRSSRSRTQASVRQDAAANAGSRETDAAESRSQRAVVQRMQQTAALINGGDSGIGRAVAIAFARESADVLISYLNEHDDAEETGR